MFGPRGKDQPQQVSTSFHLQQAQSREEDTAEAIMVMKGNSNVLLSLRNFYQQLLENDRFPLRDISRSDVISFTTQVDSFIYDSNMQIERGRLLADNIAARKTMVCKVWNETTCCWSGSLRFVDSATPSKPGDREDGEIDHQHAKRLLDCQDYSFSYIHLSSRDVCVGMYLESASFILC